MGYSSWQDATRALLRPFVDALVQVLRLLLDCAFQSASAFHGGRGGRRYAGSVKWRRDCDTRAAQPPLVGRPGAGLRSGEKPVCLQHFLREPRDDSQGEQQADEPEPAALAMRGTHISSRKQPPMRKKAGVRRAPIAQSDQFRV